MKRAVLFFTGLILFINQCAAQTMPRSQGTAIQELQASGMNAGFSDSSIPVGSKLRVTNPVNGMEIEVTVIYHLPESSRTVVDLSTNAALALDIDPRLNRPVPVLITPVIIRSSAAVPALAPPVEEAPAEQTPITTTDDIPAEASDWQERPLRRNPFVPYEEPAAPPVAETPPEEMPLFNSPPVADIEILPELPDPNTDKVYSLLAGTYVGLDNAFLVYRQLQAAGFYVDMEQTGDTYRVFAVYVPASRVYYAAQRLGAIGFQQIWVME